MSEERWLPILGFEGKYDVSDSGRVRSLFFVNRSVNRHRETPLCLSLSSIRGRPSASLCLHGKVTTAPVSKLVMAAFVGPRPTKWHIAHLNGDPADNRVENLRYVTPSENERHKAIHGRVPWKLTPEQLLEARHLRAEGWTWQRLGSRYGVHYVNVYRRVMGITEYGKKRRKVVA